MGCKGPDGSLERVFEELSRAYERAGWRISPLASASTGGN